MNEDVLLKIGSALQLTIGGKQVGTADRPEGVAHEFFGDVLFWYSPPGGISDRHIGVSCVEVEDAIGPDDVEWRVETQLSPTWQTWHKPSARKGICSRHPKRLSIASAPDRAESSRK